MFMINAYNNQYLRTDQNNMQTVLSLRVDDNIDLAPAPLTVAIVLDRSGSMGGERIKAARDGAIKVIQALDETINFMVVAFNNYAKVICNAQAGTPHNKQAAIQLLQSVNATGGTCMSTALNAVVDALGQENTRATKILFLTDGKNEGEKRPVLDQAVTRCAAANISINAWGVGTDWDATELRHIADATHGYADIIPTPQQVASAFASSFYAMRKTALMNARLVLWTPAGVSVTAIQQVYPSLAALDLQPDKGNPRQQIVNLGSFAPGDQYEYLCDLILPVYASGQQFLVLRPAIRYVLAASGEQEEKSTRVGWSFAQWTSDTALAAKIEPHIAHYTNQEELAQRIQEGQDALASGDRAKATRLLGEALEISERTHNERITRLLNTIVLKDSNGTVQLNQQADAVARKTLAINVGRTSKLS